MLDAISLSILRAVALEEFSYGAGPSPYKIMKEMSLYPSFLYNLIKRLESLGIIECERHARGSRCTLTIYGLLLLYKLDGSSKVYAQRLLSRKLGLREETLRPVLDAIISGGKLPRSLMEFVGWCILNSHIPEVKALLHELSPARAYICA
jgi:DNA-binding MarR family transcriptional regulator